MNIIFKLFWPSWLFFFMMGINTMVHAQQTSEWILLPQTIPNTNCYYDRSSIQTDKDNGHMKTFHLLFENNNASKNITNSIIVETTIDCTNQSGRIEQIIFYDQPRAQGNMLITNTQKNDFIKFNDDNASKLLNTICHE